MALARYVERNPVRAKIVKRPWEYRWSSAAYHTGKSTCDPLVRSDKVLQELVGDWKEYIKTGDNEEDLEQIRKEHSSGRPIGSDKFIKSLEKKSKRVLQRGLPGRPRVKERV